MTSGDETVQTGDCRPRLKAGFGCGGFRRLLLREHDSAAGQKEQTRPHETSKELHDAPRRKKCRVEADPAKARQAGFCRPGLGPNVNGD